MINASDDVYDALRLTEDKRQTTLKAALAASLYQDSLLSFGKARKLTDRSNREFHRLLGEQEVTRHYTREELDENRAYSQR